MPERGKALHACLLALAVLAPAVEPAAPLLAQVSISPWPAPARAAVSITFDDAYPSHVFVAAPLLEERGFRGTFYLIADKLLQRGRFEGVACASVAAWQGVAARGHEIGSHTLSHVPLDSLPVRSLLEELHVSRRTLEELLPEARITSLAYPFSRADAVTVQFAGYLYTSGRLGPPPVAGAPAHTDPASVDVLGVPSLFLCGGEEVSRWNAAVNRAVAAGGWLVETVHAVDEPGYCSVPAASLAAHLDYLARCGGAVWVAPVASVVERIRQWRQLAMRLTTQSARRALLEWTAAPHAGYDWEVSVQIAQPAEWRLRAADGRRLTPKIAAGSLEFTWSSDLGDGAVLLERLDSTAVAPSSWALVKERAAASAPSRAIR